MVVASDLWAGGASAFAFGVVFVLLAPFMAAYYCVLRRALSIRSIWAWMRHQPEPQFLLTRDAMTWIVRLSGLAFALLGLVVLVVAATQ